MMRFEQIETIAVASYNGNCSDLLCSINRPTKKKLFAQILKKSLNVGEVLTTTLKFPAFPEVFFAAFVFEFRLL
jgi:hypothetical protein